MNESIHDSADYQRASRHAQWLMLGLAPLFVGFGVLTWRVEGGGPFAWAAVAIGLGLALASIMLYVESHPSWRRRVGRVLLVAGSLTVGAIIGGVIDSPAKTEAHTIQCAPPAKTGNAVMDAQKERLWKNCLVLAMQHAAWHQQHDVTVAVAGNLRSAPSRVECRVRRDWGNWDGAGFVAAVGNCAVRTAQG